MVNVNKKKYIYVIFDPLLERVVCVHDKSQKECELCKPIRSEKRDSYHLEEIKCLIQTEFK
jgi:hypothetical protein